MSGAAEAAHAALILNPHAEVQELVIVLLPRGDETPLRGASPCKRSALSCSRCNWRVGADCCSGRIRTRPRSSRRRPWRTRQPVVWKESGLDLRKLFRKYPELARRARTGSTVFYTLPSGR